MRKFKKALAFALASAMIVSVVPVSAATSNTAKAGKSTIYYNGNASYKSTWVKTTTKKGYTTKFFNQNAKVATLNKKTGKVTAKKAGTAQIKVNFYKSGKYVGNKIVKISVKKAPVAYGIKVENATLNVGETTNVVTSNGVKVNCYSADKSIVTVNKTTGKVTAVAPGTTKIAVRNAYTSKKVYVDVTVNAVDAPAAKQTGAKTITVTNGTSMSDRTITVKRGTSTVALASDKGVVFSEDGKTATITTAGKLANADYTVVVTAKDNTVKESTLTATAEKVSKIAILNDKAGVLKNSEGQYMSAQVGYKVENQFGEDITKQTSLTVSGTDNPTLDPSNHKITFSRTSTGSAYIIGRDIVNVVLVHTETGVTASATLTISNEPAVETLTFEGVYNVDGKTLTDDIDLDNDEFYLLYSAVDQYGATYKDYKNIAVNNSNGSSDLHVSVAGASNLKAADNAFKKITKDGKEYIGVKLAVQTTTEDLRAGTSSVMAIATTSGKTTTNDVVVNAGNKARTITVSQPTTLAAGEKTELTYTALDANGKEVTSYDALKDVEISGTSDALKWEKDAKTGNAKLVFDGTKINNPGKNNKAYASYTLKTVDNKFSNVQLTISETARPVSVTGLKDITGKVTSGASVTVKVKDLQIEDQYGRIMDEDALNRVIKSDDARTKLTGVVVKGTSNDDFTITLGENVEKLTSASDVVFKIVANRDKTASTSINLALNAGDGTQQKTPLTGSDTTVDFSIVRQEGISDVTVEVNSVYVPSSADMSTLATKYKKEVVVKGKGAKLTADQFSVSSTRNLQAVKEDGKWYVYANRNSGEIFSGANESKDSITDKITITLNTGEVVTTQEVTLSKTAPKIAKFTLNKDTLNITSGSAVGVKEIVSKLDIDTLEDSYGVDRKADIDTLAFKIRFKDVDVSAIANNGTENATITLPAGKTATAIIYTGNNTDVSVTVNLTAN